MNPSEPQGSALDHTSAIETAVNDIREKINEIARRFTAGIENVNKKWFDLPPAVMLRVRDLLENIRAAINKVLDIVSAVLAHYSPIISMIDISFHWLHAVKRPISNMAGATAKWATPDLASWDGDTAVHYKEQVLVFQSGATEALADQAGFISAWLYEIVQANVDYVTELASVVATIAGDLAAAAIEAATVVDLPFAIADLAAAVGVYVESSVNNLIGIASRIIAAGERSRQVVDSLVDERKFTNGLWPQSVTPPEPQATMNG
ncbi:hypothetical protein AB0M20_27640 [Actinoplanes sp. NPDC051633]|uniref:hypothetical protein n=1 Tax=Actinoplanes sp. NPDC051633 TaxID=3155670 RepID=UPI003444D9B9